MHLSPRRLTGAALTAAALAAALPAVASADPVAEGATTLTLNSGTKKAFKALGLKATALSGARSTGPGVVFPATGGDIDFNTLGGTITHRGALRLAKGSKRVTLSAPTVKIGPSSTITAVVGGTRTAALVPLVGSAKTTTTAIGTVVTNIAVRPSKSTAAALNKAFGPGSFNAKNTLGTLSVKVVRGLIAVDAGTTKLTLDPAAAGALQGQGIAAGVAAPATANPDGSFAFPISPGGRLAVDTLKGTITHTGGITLTKGATVVTLADFAVDTAAKQLTATVNGGARVPLLALDLTKGKLVTKGREVTVGPLPGTLTQDAANALNGAFATTAFAAGLPIGTAAVAGRSN